MAGHHRTRGSDDSRRLSNSYGRFEHTHRQATEIRGKKIKLEPTISSSGFAGVEGFQSRSFSKGEIGLAACRKVADFANNRPAAAQRFSGFAWGQVRASLDRVTVQFPPL
jgi:hypothetical protein